MLGVPVAQSIASARLEANLVNTLEKKLNKLKSRFWSLAARTTGANSIILGSLWYSLTIWANNDKFLSKLQRSIDHFLWSGRNRVANAVVALPKSEGGLGLINIAAQ